MQAAKKWEAQLTDAGAAVKTFSLYGFRTGTGKRVSDLNDLLLSEPETLDSEAVRSAFFDWGF